MPRMILTLTRPDDWHLHLRDGEYLKRTVADVAKSFGRAIVMPNLDPPITTVPQALAYRERIIQFLPEDAHFNPLMTLYLTEQTTTDDIKAMVDSEHMVAVKLYPAGATTHSAAGVRTIEPCYPVFTEMEKAGIPLLIHGEVTDEHIDIFDREAVFIERTLTPLRSAFPNLKIVLEHITTQQAVDYILSQNKSTAATITAHHLWLNRNDLLAGGLKPHHYCLPVVKREQHQHALIQAATSGCKQFFIGTDSAPHPRNHKESACGCAGIYTAYAAIEYYAQIFAKAHALNKLEGFVSHFGADFYGMPRNQDTILLEQHPFEIPETLTYGKKEKLIPFLAGKTIDWRVKTSRSSLF